ncbi:MAG: hypothetical protein AAB512_02120 [Patescibacteria group bacterium]
MKNNLAIFLILLITTFAVWKNSVNTFFVQDDFIMFEKFAQSGLANNLKKALFSYQETHWRPVDNFYYLISGRLFGLSYKNYHYLAIFIHAAASYLIFLIVNSLLRNKFSSLVSSIFYAIHPAFFVSIYWISGGATEIGFVFLLLAIFLWIRKKFYLSLLSFALSTLASEAMVVGLFFILVIEFFKDKSDRQYKFAKTFIVYSLFFSVLRFIFLTPKTLLDVYSPRLSIDTLWAIKYYALRVLGFAEISGDFYTSFGVIIFLLAVLGGFSKKFGLGGNMKILLIAATLILSGFFPFILLPYHLSPHYMNLSIFGLSIIVGFAFSIRQKRAYIFLLILFATSLSSISLIEKNNWVVERSKVSKFYIDEIQKTNLPPGSTLVFNDNPVSSSYEAYISLGAGEGIDFFFKDKNYKTCFSAFESCNILH